MPVARIISENNDRYSCLIDDQAALLWVVNLASLEIHVPLYLTQDQQRPTIMVFDLDPGIPAGIVECVSTALEMRKLFRAIGLQSFVKTSGLKGMHIYVPFNTPVTFSQTKRLAYVIARAMEKKFPDRVVSSMRKALRRGKVFIDWSQNDQHKTTVSVYSLRAGERPTVSTPVTWEEIEDFQNHSLQTLSFEAPEVLQRVKNRGDLFASVLEYKQHFPNSFFK